MLNDRAADNWRLLFSIADICGQHWPAEARKAAHKISGDNIEAQNSKGELVLFDIREIFTSMKQPAIPSKALCDRLSDLDNRQWSEWRRGQPITPVQLAKLLKPYRISPGTIRLSPSLSTTHGQTPKGYRQDQFNDAFTRYLGGLSAPAPQLPMNAATGPSPSSADGTNGSEQPSGLRFTDIDCQEPPDEELLE
jgi:hypothetical protein